MAQGATDLKTAARAAHNRAADLERQILRRWPLAWVHMDHVRADPPAPWPDWCLLPMAGAAAVAGGGFPPGPVAVVSALYAWRYSRSVWLIEPGLTERLLTQIPDTVGVGDLATLPEWCVYIAGDHPEFPGAGLWMHLEYDVNTGRPELRLLLDPTGDTALDELDPIPVYLDRPTITEALADYRATSLASLHRSGANVRGGELDASVGNLADRVDAYLGIAAYLCRPEADIRALGAPGLRPVKPRSPVRGRSTWLVGYGG